MTAQRTELWLTLTWQNEVLQTLRLDEPRAVWLAEDGDLVLPADVIGAPRLLVVNHGEGQWLHPDGRVVAVGEEVRRTLGDFELAWQLAEAVPHRLPLAWPQELAQLGLALACAVALVATPLWLGGRPVRKLLTLSPDDVAAAAVVPLAAYIADQQALPEPEPATQPEDRTLWFPPAQVVADKPEPMPVPVPVDVPRAPVTTPTTPHRSQPHVAEADPHALLNTVAVPDPQAPHRSLFGEDGPGDRADRQGTDNPHTDALADGRAQKPDLSITAPPQGPHKIGDDRDLDLTPGHQDIVKVRAPKPVVEGNGLDADTVQRVIGQMHGQLRHCLELGMLGSEKLQGRVKVGFVIAPDGAVLQARVEDSTLHQSATEDCIADRVRTWQFPASQSGLPTRVKHGFVFRVK